MALVVCFCLLIVLWWEGGNFRLWSKSVTICATYVQMVALSFVTLVCSPSMSVIIADLAKRSI